MPVSFLVLFLIFHLQVNLVIPATHKQFRNTSKTSHKYNRKIDAGVSFYLFTKSKPLKEHKILCKNDSIVKSHFNNKYPTRIVIHGWTSSYNETMGPLIANAWFSRGSYNIIAVDWPKARNLFYPKARWAVREAGEKVGSMIMCMHERYGMSLKTLHVIGFSLGAHVAGYAGKYVGGRKINTIVGLDPAKPMFKHSDPGRRLSNTDARYVEVIHTNGNSFGFLEPIGTSDYYVNGGMSQPDCGYIFSNICSHSRAYVYYERAITHRSYGTIKCTTYKNAVKKVCGKTFSNVLVGALRNSKMDEGPFYVPVNKKAPYGRTRC